MLDGKRRASVREQLISTHALIRAGKTSEASLEVAIGVAALSSREVHSYVLDMLSSFRLMGHASGWRHAVDALREASKAKKETLGHGAPPLCELLLALMQAAEPTHAAHAAAVLLRHADTRKGCDVLRVVAATADAKAMSARLKVSAEWKASSPFALGTDAHRVLSSATPLLRSPYGEAPDASSAVPLLQRDGRCLGVLLSAAPAYPDELVEAMARHAGPLIEHAAKRRAASDFCEEAVGWMRRASYIAALTEARPDPLSMIDWIEGAEAGFCTAGGGANVRDLTPEMLLMLHASARVIQRAVEAIGSGRVGDDWGLPADAAAFNAAVARVHADCVASLPHRLAVKLSPPHVEAHALIAEMKAYTKPAKEVTKVLCAVLCLFGHHRKNLRKWEDMRRHLTTGLIVDMRTATTKPLGRLRWKESALAIKGVKPAKLLGAGSTPLPIKILLKWYVAIRLIRELEAGAAADEDEKAQGAPPEPPATAPSRMPGGGKRGLEGTTAPAEHTPVQSFAQTMPEGGCMEVVDLA